MSTSNPVLIPSIPSPTDDPPSIVQALWAIKQNIEVAQGTRGTAMASSLHQATPTAVAISAALKGVTKTY